MLSRALQLTGLQNQNHRNPESVLQSFADGDAIPDWARDAAAGTIEAGLFNGYATKQLAPQKSLTRAEMASIVERLLRKSGLI